MTVLPFVTQLSVFQAFYELHDILTCLFLLKTMGNLTNSDSLAEFHNFKLWSMVKQIIYHSYFYFLQIIPFFLCLPSLLYTSLFVSLFSFWGDLPLLSPGKSKRKE